MDQGGIANAIGALSSICQKPEHIEFLAYLSTQPPDQLETVLKAYASKLNPALIPAMVDAEFAHMPPELRAALAQQATDAYNFLTPT